MAPGPLVFMFKICYLKQGSFEDVFFVEFSKLSQLAEKFPAAHVI